MIDRKLTLIHSWKCDSSSSSSGSSLSNIDLEQSIRNINPSRIENRAWKKITRHELGQKLDMCLWNTDAPSGNKVKIRQKSLSSTFWPHPQGHVMSVKCEEPIDELTVQVWLLYHHPNFKYCTLFVSGTELQTDRRTDRRTIRLLDAPGGPFKAGA